MNKEIIKKETTELKNAYASAGQNFMEKFGDDLDGIKLRFDRIKIPSGGGLAFEMPSDDPNNPDMLKEFKAVIIYHHPMGSYYSEKYAGGNQPPECSSSDGKSGIVQETGETIKCYDCPHNKFGSGENGAKACKQKRRIFLLREGELLPTLLSIPTGSLGVFGIYIQRLLKKGKKSSGVVTKFSLKKVQNKGGIAFSQVICSVDRELIANEQKAITSMADQVKALSGRITEPVQDE